MDDLISRQDAINVINEAMNNDYLSTFTPYVRCKNAVEKLPSVKPQPICEEREKGECPWYAG